MLKDCKPTRSALAKFLISVALFCFVSILLFFFSPKVYLGNSFARYSLPLQTYDLHDIGLADVDGNGYLDIYTTHHSARQNLLFNQGDGKFTERFESLGLSQDKLFPGLEISNESITESEPGLYIFRKEHFRWNKSQSDNVLVISARDLDQIESTESLSGQLKILSSVNIKHSQGVSVTHEEEQLSNGVTSSSIQFSFNGAGRLEITSDLTALPCSIQLNDVIPLEHVYVGFNKVNPENYDLELHWKDRHGMGWADYDSDADLDVFISRGGLKGRLEDIGGLPESPVFTDELYITGASTMEDTTRQSGIEKGNCPGRQVAWNDFDGDGLLDLYIVCGRSDPPLDKSPNLLYKQLEDGSFKEIAEDVGLAHLEVGSFKWLDIDNDGKNDFLWATSGEIDLYMNNGDSFSKEWSIATQMNSVRSVSLSDYDSDGDIDVFIVGSPTNLVLVNDGNQFIDKNPDELGLPQKAAAAQWVDFDNDGLTDFYAIPGGIYKQQENHHFESTSILSQKVGLSQISAARSIWFDIDNNGSLDLITAINYQPWWVRLIGKFLRQDVPPPRDWQVATYKNRLSGESNWLKIDLLGHNGGQDAIGATIVIDNGSTIQKHLVGESDSSRYSQGQYRMYQGMGSRSEARQIDITWPDGTLQSITNISANQQLVVRQASTS